MGKKKSNDTVKSTVKSSSFHNMWENLKYRSFQTPLMSLILVMKFEVLLTNLGRFEFESDHVHMKLFCQLKWRLLKNWETPISKKMWCIFGFERFQSNLKTFLYQKKTQVCHKKSDPIYWLMVVLNLHKVPGHTWDPWDHPPGLWLSF